ncbi:MAG: tetratricopeptide repeat protein [Candidatus Thiodubiliella endoseptemdiera]|uniref:Tetratricopeptide repeat protein n=1 Tax=Candidatus Thiodubiliella endoseptemdiera TaxID=2738886 RepID=A0A853F5H9_9GAMM|nr:tetratricopeptide repeat protein [Candidatus Thiodubiliella endoseptemdiera]
MGDAYDELKEYQKAINAYQKAIEIKPNDVAYNNMGMLIKLRNKAIIL